MLEDLSTPTVDVPQGLSYVTDTKPGFKRERRGKAFTYYDKGGKVIKDQKIIDRINAIGIPPAYEQVWICPTANGHIQATGLDARGRKQYRYHAKWREARDENKFQHILQFADALPAIRQRIQTDMGQRGLSRDKVLATVVSLLEKTLIRVGNSEYAQSNQSYGLTTLQPQHVQAGSTAVRFRFKGKSGKEWNLSVSDRRIARIVRQCADIPGQELFKYVDNDGVARDVTSQDVNAYLKELTGGDFTAKDFRTWSGTVLAALALNEVEKYETQTEAKRNIKQAIDKVARQLGNTPAICRKCYIHPDVIEAYMTGETASAITQEIDRKFKKKYDTLTPDEIMVLAFLKKRLS